MMMAKTTTMARAPIAPTFGSCQKPGRTVTPFSRPPNGPDFILIGLPQLGHEGAFDDTSLLHSGHLIIAIATFLQVDPIGIRRDFVSRTTRFRPRQLRLLLTFDDLTQFDLRYSALASSGVQPAGARANLPSRGNRAASPRGWRQDRWHPRRQVQGRFQCHG